MLLLLQLFSIVALVASETSPTRFHNAFWYKTLKDDINYRLSTDVIPKSYQLELTLASDFYTTKSFTGNVKIALVIDGDKVDSFNIHAKDLSIKTSDIHIYLYNETTTDDLFKDNKGPDPQTDFLTINTKSLLPKGQTYSLEITYSGKLSDTSMTGFYLSSYKSSDGNTTYLATTHFEETGARKAFPCFDEPALKATFNITIKYPKGYNALSNMEPKEDAKLDTVHFKTTPEMSTYLVAFVVSDLKCQDGKDETFKTSVCSRPETKEAAALALSVTSNVIAVMKSYTGESSAIGKVGKVVEVAVPDMGAGAMENWGLLIYREAYLLYDAKESPLSHKQKVVTVIAHEISHQWFGDLVTCDWWSDIFLNEGFATYFEYYAPDKLADYSEWELTKQFVVDQLQTAFVADSTGNSKPLHWEINDPSAIGTNGYGDIIYNKGGSVLRMVHHLLGLENFQKGLYSYISKGPIGTPNILWSALGENVPADIPSKNLSEIMDSWTNKPGYPVLTVTSDGDNVTISQKRFVLSGEPEETKWYVPITYSLSKNSSFSDTTTKEWLTPDSDLQINSVLKDQDWIILNNQQVGFYRVNYDDKLWKNIVKSLENNVTRVDEISRAQIVDDLLNFARANQMGYSKVLNYLKFLEKDDSYYSWTSAFNNFKHLLQTIRNKDTKKALNKYILEHMKGLLNFPKTIVWKDKKHIEVLKTVLALTWATNLDDNKWSTTYKTKFDNYRDNDTYTLDPNERSIAYCTGLRKTSNASKDYSFLWEKYISTDLASEKVTILEALGCISDSASRKLYLKEALGEKIKLQDAKYVFSSVYSTGDEGVTDLLDFITENHKNFTQHFGSTSTLSSLIATVADLINSDSQYKKLEQFSNTEDLDVDYKNTATHALEVAKTNVKTAKKVEKQLNDFFNTNNNSAALNLSNLALVIISYFIFNFV